MTLSFYHKSTQLATHGGHSHVATEGMAKRAAGIGVREREGGKVKTQGAQFGA